MAEYDVLRCFGVNIGFAYFNALDIVEALGIRDLVLSNKRVSSLTEQHFLRHPIVQVAIRQVALLELQEALDGPFLPYNSSFRLDAIYTGAQDSRYDAEERFLWLCWSLASGKSVKSLKYLYEESGTREMRAMFSAARSVYSFLRRGLNDNTRQLILNYREGKLDEIQDSNDFDAGESGDLALSAESRMDIEDMDKKTGMSPVSFDAEIGVAVALMKEGENLLKSQVVALQKGESLSVQELRHFCQKLYLSHERNQNALLVVRYVRDVDAYLPQHALGMAILACHLGKALKLSGDYIEALILGALLLDIGRFKLPAPIALKTGKLSGAELELMRKHTIFGERMLGLYTGLPKLVVSMLKEHHERMDGTGYPHAKIDEEISIYGKIAAIIDAYDSITSSQPHKSSVGPVEAWSLMRKEAGVAFDREVLSVFLRSVGKIPVGTCVELSNGRAGYVLALNDKSRPSLVRQVYSGGFILPTDVRVDSGDGIEIVKVLSQDELGSNFIDHIML